MKIIKRNGAEESFDTLKEISDWIATHEDSAATMNTKIVQNQNDIKALQSLIDKVAGYVPVGTMLQGLYATAPTGFLLCNGQEVAIASFPELYAVIGAFAECQSKNEGMFKVPDLRGRFLEGANGNLGNRIEAGLPNIVGYFASWDASGACKLEYSSTNSGFAPGGLWNGVEKGSVKFSASKSSSIYGNSNTVQPPAMCVNYIIKY